jgi:hypothetical protein
MELRLINSIMIVFSLLTESDEAGASEIELYATVMPQ